VSATKGRLALPLLTDLPPAPSAPRTGTPPRAPGSVRRTAHWHVTFPGGIGTAMHVEAAARDLVTGADGAARELGRATAQLVVSPGRHLESVQLDPELPGAADLVGARGGSGFRAALAAAVPDAAGRLGHLLLDDVPGVTLVGPYAWREFPEWAQRPRPAGRHPGPGHDMTGVCTGFRPDGWPAALLRTGGDLQQRLAPAPPAGPEDPADALGWHTVPPAVPGTVLFRRRRRIDVAGGPEITVDSWFRDSLWHPDGREKVVHEYGVTARVDGASCRLIAVAADPRVLPFPTCPAAAGHVRLLVDEPVGTLRSRVPGLLPGTDGCTHLNDALRALAEVPALVSMLPPG
jgi:hypothetical protein